MSNVSTLRLYLLRAMYLFMVVGLGLTIWPRILDPGTNVSLMGSVVRGMLGALAVMALWGVRYPIAMLPVLLFELLWKVIWVIAFALGPWLAGELDADRQRTLYECLLGVVLLPIAIPWGHVYRHYVRAPGDRWGGQGTGVRPAPAGDAPSARR